MNHFTKIGLLASIVGTYSCHTPNKAAKTDTTKVTITAKKTITTQIASEPSEEENVYTNLQKINFGRFDSEINGLQVAFGVNGTNIGDSVNQKFIFSNNKKKLTINEKADTVSLFINDELDNKLIKIIPLEKNDQFKISYCYSYIIEHEKGGAVYIADTTSYKPIKDSANYFFRMPTFKNLSPISEIKERLKVTDTVVRTLNGEYGDEKYTAYVVKNNFFVISAQNLWIKIERFQNNNLQETKIIKFYDFDED